MIFVIEWDETHFSEFSVVLNRQNEVCVMNARY